jgi:hypothetical protein
MSGLVFVGAALSVLKGGPKNPPDTQERTEAKAGKSPAD